jgi:hypothetical protein
MAQDMLNPLPTGERKEVVEESNMIPSPLGERVRVRGGINVFVV